jgi:hypothetical protein
MLSAIFPLAILKIAKVTYMEIQKAAEWYHNCYPNVFIPSIKEEEM